MRELVGHKSSVIFIGFGSGGQLITASADRSIRVWNDWNNLATSQVLRGGHGEAFTQIALSHSGQLVAGYMDGTASVWDLAAPRDRPYVLRGQLGDFRALIVSADGRWLKESDLDGNVRTWDLSFEGVIETACRLVGRNFTQEEWLEYFPGKPYRKTCEQWPTDPSAIPGPLSLKDQIIQLLATSTPDPFTPPAPNPTRP